MAASVISKPGSEHGPCKGRCKHRDCRQTVTDAQSACRFCLKPIGYETLYYRARFDGCLAHATCLETAVERNDARVGLF